MSSMTKPMAVALLLAAHGERRERASNAGIIRLAAELRSYKLVQEVATGFIKGTPTIAESVAGTVADEIIVYPLFLSDGYFTRQRLPRLLQAALAQKKRRFHLLPPLGLDPALVGLIIDRLVTTARQQGVTPQQSTVILLAHGSTNDPASRLATEQAAEQIRKRLLFRAVRVALLEESPSLADAASDAAGPILVFGLFAGEGIHGADDAPRLVAQLGRPDAIFAGTLASLGGLAQLIAAAVRNRTPAQWRSRARITPAPTTIGLRGRQR
jgi:sirohydrochlorin cobaltochelatase